MQGPCAHHPVADPGSSCRQKVTTAGSCGADHRDVLSDASRHALRTVSQVTSEMYEADDPGRHKSNQFHCSQYCPLDRARLADAPMHITLVGKHDRAITALHALARESDNKKKQYRKDYSHCHSKPLASNAELRISDVGAVLEASVLLRHNPELIDHASRGDRHLLVVQVCRVIRNSTAVIDVSTRAVRARSHSRPRRPTLSRRQHNNAKSSKCEAHANIGWSVSKCAAR
jgi:hypothetical protein